MARAAVLLLVADPVVRDTKTRAEDVLKKRPEPNIKVVGHDV
jgi:Ni,Fe-hydrogenase III small subunit